MSDSTNEIARELAVIATNIDWIRESFQTGYEDEIVVTALRDGSGAVVVLPIGKTDVRNAQIVDASGTCRAKLEVPIGFEQGLGFADAYYVNDQLTAIFVTTARDFAFVIDESSGNVIRTYETR